MLTGMTAFTADPQARTEQILAYVAWLAQPDPNLTFRQEFHLLLAAWGALADEGGPDLTGDETPIPQTAAAVLFCTLLADLSAVADSWASYISHAIRPTEWAPPTFTEQPEGDR